ncbi:hypothetical protein E3P91_01722 [Wallemia ichthyophaga]|nr:hypothetical protein E3P91_01722 [Wallemia ichthyophaga]
MSENGEQQVEVPQEEVEVAEAAPAGKMSVEEALQQVLKNALYHDGLARGLRECAKALDRRAAHLCVLVETCTEAEYIKLIEALCAEHQINLIKVSDAKVLGTWAGLCKIDREGNARKVVGTSCVVVRDFGVESEDSLWLYNWRGRVFCVCCERFVLFLPRFPHLLYLILLWQDSGASQMMSFVGLLAYMVQLSCLPSLKNSYKLTRKHPKSLIIQSLKPTNNTKPAELISYLTFLQNCVLQPTDFLYSIEVLELNLEHFNKSTRLLACPQLSTCINKMPVLQKLTLTLDALIETENTHLLIGRSDGATELTINIDHMTHLKAAMLAIAICDKYFRIKLLRIHRPSLVDMPGFDLITQEHFIAILNALDSCYMRKPNMIIFKNYELVKGSITTDTPLNLLHIYIRAFGKFTDSVNRTCKKRALLKYYITKRTQKDEMSALKGFHIDIVALKFNALNNDLQKCCKLFPFVRGSLRVLLQDKQTAEILYRAYSVREEMEHHYPGLIAECLETHKLLTLQNSAWQNSPELTR